MRRRRKRSSGGTGGAERGREKVEEQEEEEEEQQVRKVETQYRLFCRENRGHSSTWWDGGSVRVCVCSEGGVGGRGRG